MATDLYSTLGLGRDASEKEIRDAYRRLARQFHPDVNPNNTASEQRFKEINAAYEVLSNPDNRAKYDKYGDNWQHADEIEEQMRRRGGASWYRNGPAESSFSYSFEDEGDGDLGSIFGNIFRGSERGSPRPRKGRDLEVPVEVTLAEAASGTTRMLDIAGDMGSNKRIEVSIPAGVATGSRVRLAGKGQPGRSGGPNGDLFLTVTVRPHERFERRDDDLIVEIPVPVLDAILGGEVEVPTLTGRVALTIPQLTQNGRQFRLRGKGMPHLGSSDRRGDLIARVNVRLPETLSPRERELFEQIRAEAAVAAGAEGT
jgi:DnaJ-class molecular chaperone